MKDSYSRGVFTGGFRFWVSGLSSGFRVKACGVGFRVWGVGRGVAERKSLALGVVRLIV